MPDLVTKKGFKYRFDPTACKKCKGNCCIGESGYIWVTDDEIHSIAQHLKISKNEFVKKFLVKIGYRYSIKEKVYEGGFACIFFDDVLLRCGIYEVRPNQCRTFPFWNYFKTRENEVKEECPGVLFL